MTNQQLETVFMSLWFSAGVTFRNFALHAAPCVQGRPRFFSPTSSREAVSEASLRSNNRDKHNFKHNFAIGRFTCSMQALSGSRPCVLPRSASAQPTARQVVCRTPSLAKRQRLSTSTVCSASVTASPSKQGQLHPQAVFSTTGCASAVSLTTDLSNAFLQTKRCSSMMGLWRRSMEMCIRLSSRKRDVR